MAQFHQHPVARFRVQECHQFVVGAALRLAVQRDEAFGFEPFDFCADIVDFEGNVMNAFPAFINKFCNGTFRIGSLQEFYFAFADVEKRSGNFFTFNRFDLVMRFAE